MDMAQITKNSVCVCVCVCVWMCDSVCVWNVSVHVCEMCVSVWVTVWGREGASDCVSNVLDSHDRCRYSLSDWLSARASSYSPLWNISFSYENSLIALSAAGILNVIPTTQCVIGQNTQQERH